MALFKIAKGKSVDLPEKTIEGYAYFTTDTGEFYIDTATTADDSINSRTMLNGLAFINGESGDHEGAWLANHSGLTLRDGLPILYRPNINGSDEENYETIFSQQVGVSKSVLSNTCLNLNSLGWKKCYISKNEYLTTQFESGSTILMIYNASLDNGNGGWQVLGNPSSLSGREVETEILDENSENIPTSGAVIRYIKSLSYDGGYYYLV